MAQNNKLFALPLAFAALLTTSSVQAVEWSNFVPTSLDQVPSYALKGLAAAVLLKTAHMVWSKPVPVNEIKRSPKESNLLTRSWDIVNNDIFGQMSYDFGYVQKTIIDENGKEIIIWEKAEIPATGLIGKIASRYKDIALVAGFVVVASKLLGMVGVSSPTTLVNTAVTTREFLAPLK